MNELNSETTHPMENHGEVALPDSLLEGIKVTARLTNVTCFVIETSTYRVLHKTSGVHHITDTDYSDLPWHSCNALWPQIFKDALGRLKSSQEKSPLHYTDEEWDEHIRIEDYPIEVNGRVFCINLQFTPIKLQDRQIGLIIIQPATCKQQKSLLVTSSGKIWEYNLKKDKYCLKDNIRITPTEMSVLVLAKGGWPIKLIAFWMNISIATVKTYRARAFKKLGVSSITEALAVMGNYHWG